MISALMEVILQAEGCLVLSAWRGAAALFENAALVTELLVPTYRSVEKKDDSSLLRATCIGSMIFSPAMIYDGSRNE